MLITIILVKAILEVVQELFILQIIPLLSFSLADIKLILVYVLLFDDFKVWNEYLGAVSNLVEFLSRLMFVILILKELGCSRSELSRIKIENYWKARPLFIFN